MASCEDVDDCILTQSAKTQFPKEIDPLILDCLTDLQELQIIQERISKNMKEV